MKGLITKIIDLVPLGLRSHIKNIPGLKQLQAFVLRRYIGQHQFNATISAGPAKGLNFPVQMPDDKLMWIGTWELAFAEALSAVIQPGWICYDVGGYKGYYSGIMALRGAKEVYVFEPMPANAEKIGELIRLNPALPIRLEETALSNKTETTTFNIMPEATMGKLSSSNFDVTGKAAKEIQVSCMTLDDFVAAGHPVPDFLKIDVEGAETSVLEGGMKMIRNRKPKMMIEIHSRVIGKQCLSLLKDHYSSVKVFETNLPPGNGEEEICHYIVQ